MDVKGLHDFEEKPTVDGTPVLTESAGEISALTEKTSPVAADVVIIEDSADSNNKKKVQVGNLGIGDDDLASVTARRTTTLAMTTAYQDVTFDSTQVENDTSVVEHDNTNTDRFLVKETGLYLISWHAAFDPGATAGVFAGRVRVNDTTVIPQSQCSVEADDEQTPQSVTFTVELDSSDYVTFQVSDTQSNNMVAGAVFTITRMQGATGAQGPAGSGSSVTVKDSGANIANTPHTALDFVGGLAASDAGSGVATVSTIFGAEYQSAASEGESSTTSALFQQKLRLTTPSVPAGNYLIQWFYEHAMSGDDKQFGYRTQIDDTTTMCEGIIENKGQYADSQWRAQSGFYAATLTAAAHNIDLDYRAEGDTAYIRRARLVIWRVS